MFAPPRPNKRARISEDTTASSNQLPVTTPISSLVQSRNRRSFLSRTSRHPIFWHLDGSVVILVQKTLFKLHRSRLASQSEYFAILFKGIQDTSRQNDDDIVDVTALVSEVDGIIEDEIIDSCPVYRIARVTAEDFSVRLKALDSGIALVLTPPPFSDLVALLRGAHALSFPTVSLYASHLLREMWPADLSQLATPSEKHTRHAAEMLRLSRSCNFPEVRKRAFYELLRSASFSQASGDLDDNSFSTVFGQDEQPITCALDRIDILRLVSAREFFQQIWMRLIRAPPSPSAVPCPLEQIFAGINPSQESALQRCREARAGSVTQWTAEVIQGTIFDEGFCDPLCALEKLADMDWAGMGYCTGCICARKELWSEEREAVWRKLDRWLGLSGTVEQDSDDIQMASE
ncbi:uncharacterized protein FIBRA_02809 [Fibroporia radiculosa]|uniref:BTB domain-containing protein n=1 Tax=Fibroporia radiculosa TaxID=599839 RepID=J4G2U7_9APHY|nr:uncharacterized protein FIBRA_02809 [Fibroporia radiculosa]CCM00768.1 predicted protein [Fibroporia radiculosa]